MKKPHNVVTKEHNEETTQNNDNHTRPLWLSILKALILRLLTSMLNEPAALPVFSLEISS